MAIKLRKIIITGVTGFIGGALAKRLLSMGIRVYGVGRNRTKLETLKQYGDFIPVVADFVDYGKLHEKINERGFDMFYHFAWDGASTSRSSYKNYDIQISNIKVACDAVKSALSLQCSSSSSGGSSYQQCNVRVESNDKKDVFNPVIYGIAKKCAAEMFKAVAYINNMPCMSLVFPTTYGPGADPNSVIAFFVKKLLLHEPLNLISGMYPDDWIYIDDLVDGILSVSKPLKEYGDYYVGHRNVTTFKEKLLEMKQVLNSHSDLHFGTYSENHYVDYRSFDLGALYNDTGWEAKTSFRESILKTAEWIKKS
jgi:nucleoside-diphosphate-sugar epimerase